MKNKIKNVNAITIIEKTITKMLEIYLRKKMMFLIIVQCQFKISSFSIKKRQIFFSQIIIFKVWNNNISKTHNTALNSQICHQFYII